MGIRTMIGGELGNVLEEEAAKRGISGAMFVKTILGEWVKDSYKERMRGRKKPQGQAQDEATSKAITASIQSTPASEPATPDKGKGKTITEATGE